MLLAILPAGPTFDRHTSNFWCCYQLKDNQLVNHHLVHCLLSLLYMAVSALIDFVTSTVASHLWNPVITRMRYIIHKEENIGKLDRTIRNLEARKQEIQIRLMNSERKQETCNPEVAEWLEKVAEIESEVNEMKHGQRKRRAQSFSYWSNHETGMQAAKKLKEAEMLHEKGSFKQVSIEVPPCSV